MSQNQIRRFLKVIGKVLIGTFILGLIFLYFLFNQTIPMSYGKLVLSADYDGLITNEELNLFDNNTFKYTDGWTKWNGTYIYKNDSLVLDFSFPLNNPKTYVFENGRLNFYKVENYRKILIHDLGINLDSLERN